VQGAAGDHDGDGRWAFMAACVEAGGWRGWRSNVHFDPERVHLMALRRPKGSCTQCCMTTLMESPLIRVQARAFNAKDVETILGHCTASAQCFCDGEWVGEGHDAVRRGLQEEWKNGASVGRLHEVDGELVLVEYGDEHGEPRGVVRFRTHAGRINEFRFEHDPARL
jgi:hypothetical protein